MIICPDLVLRSVAGTLHFHFEILENLQPGTVSSGAFAVAGKGKPSGEGEGEADESASDADSGDDESNLDATNALLGGEVRFLPLPALAVFQADLVV